MGQKTSRKTHKYRKEATAKKRGKIAPRKQRPATKPENLTKRQGFTKENRRENRHRKKNKANPPAQKTKPKTLHLTKTKHAQHIIKPNSRGTAEEPLHKKEPNGTPQDR